MLVAWSLCAACAAPRSSVSQPAPSSAIEAEYETACARVADEDRRSCPLIKWSQSIEDVDGGVLMHLGQAAPPPEQTERRARCHRAWMARYGRSMRGPLSASGKITITAAAGAQGTDVTILASDSTSLEDVRARTHGAFDRERP